MPVEIPQETLKFFNNNELQARIFYEKYALKDLSGNILEKLPTEMWYRLAREIASVEKTDDKKKEWLKNFYWLMQDFRFVPGGRILFGAGSQRKVTLLNCYYLPIKEDSLESIFSTATEMARTYSFGGGVGIDISILRPRGTPVNNAAVFTTGAASFMEMFSTVTGTIGQAGRRGALMITIDVKHPDVEEFVGIKGDKTSVRFANISVKITDEFMKAVESSSKFELSFKNKWVELKKEINAAELWEKIIENALNTGDPGIMFWDRMREESPTEYDIRMAIKGTNPCLLGDTFLQTQYGLTKIEKLQTKADFLTADTTGTTKVSNVWLSGIKDVYRFNTALGYNISTTENHKIMARKGPAIDPTENLIISVLLKNGPIKGIKALSEMTGLTNGTIIRKNKSLTLKGLIEVNKTSKNSLVINATDLAHNINNFTWNEIGDLKIGDKLLMSIKEGVFPSEYIKLPQFSQKKSVKGRKRKIFSFPDLIDENIGGLLGWILTDGSATHTFKKYSRLLEDERKIRIISINKAEEKDIKTLIENSFGFKPKGGKFRNYTKVKDWVISGQNLAEFISYFQLDKRHGFIEVPEAIISSPKSVLASFIKRVFQGDGSCVDWGVTVDSTSHNFIRVLQQLLLKFGILSGIITTKRLKPRKNINVLYIRDLKSLERYQKEIGFISSDKNKALKRLIIRLKTHLGSGNTQFSSKFRWVDDSHIETILIEKEFLGKLPVYDCSTVSHSFVANGFVVHNCGEQPLSDYDACDLGSVNLEKFILNPFTEKAAVDWKNLELTIRYAVRFLDNVLDYSYSRHAIKAQADETMYARRIGLGVMGLANMLIELNIKYDTEDAIKFVDEFFKKFKEIAYDESVNISKEKGPFQAFNAEKHLERPFIKRLSDELRKRIGAWGLRNCCILTIAPTGSISTMSGVSGGAEPIFALSYIRRSESLSAENFEVLDPLVKRYMDQFELKDKKGLPEQFVVAHTIDPFFRVKMQATIQKHVDSSISSTVNLASNADKDTVKKIYEEAWKLGCKSITVYREGSKRNILTATDEGENTTKAAEKTAETPKAVLEERPYLMSGSTIKLPMLEGNLYVTVNKDASNNIKEVFLSMGRSGDIEKSYTEAIGRLISVYLQSGGNSDRVIKTLKGIKGDGSTWFNGLRLLSVPDAVAKALDLVEKGKKIETLERVVPKEETSSDKETDLERCPSCGNHTLVFENGCYSCKTCGYTRCE